MGVSYTAYTRHSTEGPMRHVNLAVVVLVLIASGCGGGDRQLPMGPSAVPAPLPSSGEPRMSPPTLRDRQPDLGRPIPLGEMVSSRVATDDPVCPGPHLFRCQYFRLTVPQDGVLEVTIRWSAAQRDPYPVDMDVIGPSGAGFSGEIASGPYRVARGRVAGGSTYVIEVWSFLTPDEPFELTTLLKQD